MASLGVPMGRTCACTPRSLLVPAGGVVTLPPSQRVSAKELEAKDREWQRQQERQPAAQTVRISPSLGRQVSPPPSYVSTASRDAGSAHPPSNTKKPKHKLYSLSALVWKCGKKDAKCER